MHTRIVVAVARAVTEIDSGMAVNVTKLSADLGIAPKTFYKWADRYRSGGLEGLQERSRRPHHSPNRISPEMENAIVEIRKRLDDDGLDSGAATIQWHLANTEFTPPSEATIWRALVRLGFVVPEPKKRPKSAMRRFEAPAPNEWWQIDATEWKLGRRKVLIINIIDDHSRFCVDSLAMTSATTEMAWQAFSNGVSRLGLPRGCLSDNGLIFSGKLRGFEVFFELKLREAGVVPITSRPYHPQTCGKVERFQQTLKKWLHKHRVPTLEDLQGQLDVFRDYYNHQRPHRGIGRRTPWQRWEAATPAAAATTVIPPPVIRRSATVNRRGLIQGKTWSIAVGVEHQGRPVTLVMQGRQVTVFVAGVFARHLELDPGRYYYPSGKPRGRPHRPRIA